MFKNKFNRLRDELSDKNDLVSLESFNITKYGTIDVFFYSDKNIVNIGYSISQENLTSLDSIKEVADIFSKLKEGIVSKIMDYNKKNPSSVIVVPYDDFNNSFSSIEIKSAIFTSSNPHYDKQTKFYVNALEDVCNGVIKK